MDEKNYGMRSARLAGGALLSVVVFLVVSPRNALDFTVWSMVVSPILLMRRGSRHQVGREVLFQRRAVEEKRDSGDLRLERIWCSGVHWHPAADIFSRRHFSALNAKRPMKKEPNQSTTAQRAGWPFWVLLNLRPPARG